MVGKNAKKATSTSSKIPPNKLPEIKPELVTPSQLVRYNPQKASSQNNPSSSRMVSLGKPVQSSSSFVSPYFLLFYIYIYIYIHFYIFFKYLIISG
jgi:hypothetical protein